MTDSWIILASGPSLTPEDIETVRQSGLKTIAVNSTWKAARFCHVIYAGDRKWWHEYRHEIDIDAKRVCFSLAACRLYKLKHHKGKKEKGYNSGMLAIDYAAQRGAKKIILLGYDCSVKHGIHHHGPHEKTHNPNPTKCEIWQGQFQYVQKVHSGVDIVNCSRYTELRAFRRGILEDEIAESLSASQVHAGGTAADLHSRS
jgi:hypothetical protein